MFYHISKEDKDLAVNGFVSINPHMRGIDFDTMMDIILDADMQIPIIGDVEMTEENQTKFVNHLISIRSNNDDHN